MFILLNGSFGIGKTTVALRLARELPKASISDPENVGFVLRRLPAWVLGLRQQPPDYQDIALWHRLIALQARVTYWRAEIVIVPMAFTNHAYLEALQCALQMYAPVHKVCLVAPLAVVRGRLTARAAAEGRQCLSEFELSRSAECVAAHDDLFFGVPVDATAVPDKVVTEIRRVIGR